jgi:general secretion pathway protein G
MKSAIKNSRRRAIAARAFTLVEVIVVIVIIAVLAGLVVPRLVGRIGDSKQGAAKSSAATLANQVRVLMVDAGGLPPDVSIRALFEKPSDLDQSKWKGPYVDSIDKLNDPWGNPYVLVVPGQKNIDFDVISYGADKKPGGEGENADVVMP